MRASTGTSSLVDKQEYGGLPSLCQPCEPGLELLLKAVSPDLSTVSASVLLNLQIQWTKIKHILKLHPYDACAPCLHSSLKSTVQQMFTQHWSTTMDPVFWWSKHEDPSSDLQGPCEAQCAAASLTSVRWGRAVTSQGGWGSLLSQPSQLMSPSFSERTSLEKDGG